MNYKRKKKFRTFLLKESLFSGTYTPKSNLFKKSYKKYQYSTLENNKKYRNEENLSISNKQNYMTILTCKNKSVYINNDRYQNSEEPQFPKINDINHSNNKEVNLYRSLHYNNEHLSQIKKKSSHKTFYLSSKKSLFNSFDIDKIKGNKKNISPKYIRLSKVFEKNLKNNLFSFNTTKPFIQEKSVKVKLDNNNNNKEYYDYIYNKLRTNYNKNFDSSFIHNIKSAYLIEFIEKKNKSILYNAKQYKYANLDEELIEEEKDKVDDKNLGTIKMFKRIRNYLINQYRKYLIGKEAREFFSKKENQINFLYDINLLPNFKNNLVKQTLNVNKLDQNNFIEHNTTRYLNIVKITIQKKKDYQNSLEYFKEEMEQDEEDIEHIELNKNYTEKYDLFDIEEYISKKKFNTSVVKRFNDSNKELFYNTFMKLHDNMKIKKYNKQF